MNKRLIQSLLLAGAVMIASAGCGQIQKSPEGKPQQAPNGNAAVQEQAPQPNSTPTPELKQNKVKLYYSDPDLSKLIEKEATVTYKQEQDRIGAAFEALKRSDDTQLISLFKNVQFTSITLDKEKGELKMDLGIAPNAQLGAPGEDLFVEALKKTAFQFAEVQSIYLLKNGKQEESLMGHVDIPYPIKRSN